MPIEIRELHIRVAVSAAPAPAPGNPPGGGTRPAPAAGQTPDKDALVAECVEQVLEILRNREER
ncbi:MAG: hypothetical protein HZT40_01520 [Candidatus Thiothrix singaporensis]|uniref:Uncharacterized protein n=1 Tax=Candidatus Thiothrix singaporensis TaxID=2799669 RepID=A0A7L6AN29_9GAMM|nr:MAG: hypothetical protein HZT40_01520 [Candidatus Thiothrix singaporensis]